MSASCRRLSVRLDSSASQLISEFSGRETWKVLPGKAPSSVPGLSTQTVPPWRSTIPLTMESPSPLPPPMNLDGSVEWRLALPIS
ncbi:hypothetical protein R80B4_02612 [Fibrobacteres bacterium R8-0-B4]